MPAFIALLIFIADSCRNPHPTPETWWSCKNGSYKILHVLSLSNRERNIKQRLTNLYKSTVILQVSLSLEVLRLPRFSTVPDIGHPAAAAGKIKQVCSCVKQRRGKQCPLRAAQNPSFKYRRILSIVQLASMLSAPWKQVKGIKFWLWQLLSLIFNLT